MFKDIPAWVSACATVGETLQRWQKGHRPFTSQRLNKNRQDGMHWAESACAHQRMVLVREKEVQLGTEQNVAEIIETLGYRKVSCCWAPNFWRTGVDVSKMRQRHTILTPEQNDSAWKGIMLQLEKYGTTTSDETLWEQFSRMTRDDFLPRKETVNAVR